MSKQLRSGFERTVVTILVGSLPYLSGCDFSKNDVIPVRQTTNDSLRIPLAIMSGFYGGLVENDKDIVLDRYNELINKGYRTLPAAIIASGKIELGGFDRVDYEYHRLLQLDFDDVSSAFMASSDNMDYRGMKKTLDDYLYLREKLETARP